MFAQHCRSAAAKPANLDKMLIRRNYGHRLASVPKPLSNREKL